MASRTEQISEVMGHLHNAAGQLQKSGYTPDLILVAMFELVLRVQHQVSGKPGVRTMLEDALKHIDDPNRWAGGS